MRSRCFVGVLVWLACAGDPTAPADAGPDVPTLDATVDAPMEVGTDAGPTPDRIVRACEEVVLTDAAAAPIEGWPLLAGEIRGTDLADYLYDTVDPEERVRVPPSGDVEVPDGGTRVIGADMRTI